MIHQIVHSGNKPVYCLKDIILNWNRIVESHCRHKFQNICAVLFDIFCIYIPSFCPFSHKINVSFSLQANFHLRVSFSRFDTHLL